MKLTNLKVINGSIINAIDASEPGTFLTSAEITTMRRICNLGKTRYLYTSNLSIYNVEDGKEIFYFGGRKDNILINDIRKNKNNARQHIFKGYYPIDNFESVLKGVKAGRILRIDLSRLELNQDKDGATYLTVETHSNNKSLGATGYKKLNKHSYALSRKAYGSTRRKNGQIFSDFTHNMSMLKKEGHPTTRIYFFPPDNIKKLAKKKPIAFVCWIHTINRHSDFYTYCANIGDFLGDPGILGIPIRRTTQSEEQRKADELLHLCKTPIGFEHSLDDLQHIGGGSYVNVSQFNNANNYKIHNDIGKNIITLSEHNLKYALSHINTFDKNLAINKIKSLSI
ncbi:MAG: hypothetical protein KAI40_12090 [Desulfobacterales bacterium]|nr:hypothetical protein [Desulfobacterales bacterium]